MTSWSRRLAAARRRSEIRRPGPALHGQPGGQRDAELGQHGLRHVPGPDPRGLQGHRGRRLGRAEGPLPAEDGLRRMVGDHEPDRAALRHRPWHAAQQGRPADDGTYRISGQKIWISGGEQDFTNNIVHLVLARIEGAPQGVKGISLFIVPKFMPDAAGEPGSATASNASASKRRWASTATPPASCSTRTPRAGWSARPIRA
jgi:hypothetical protein